MAPSKPAEVRRSQEERRDESRAKILAAAEQIFARDGLAGARTDAIAATAGVNKALLYYYFRDKESLYEAVIEEHLKDFNQKALAVLTAAGSARTLLLRYVNLHFDFVSQRRRHAQLFQQLMMKNGKPPERLLCKYIAPRAEAVQQLLVRGMQAGELRPADPFHTAISLAALVVSYFSMAPMMQRLGYPDPFALKNLKRRKQEVLDFVRHGLFVNPHTPTT
jgi:TetR/AcrR family transcriptional regulator